MAAIRDERVGIGKSRVGFFASGEGKRKKRERERERGGIYLIFEARLVNIERNSPRIFYFDFLGKRLCPNDTGLNYTNTNAFRSRPAPPAIVDLNSRAAKCGFIAYYSGLFSIFSTARPG